MFRLGLSRGKGSIAIRTLALLLALVSSHRSVRTVLAAQPSGDATANGELKGNASGPSMRLPPTAPLPRTDAPGAASNPPPQDVQINATFLGRAAVIGDSTRLAAFANGNFLPSAIPVAGQPFFGTGWRSNVQGTGSAVRLDGHVITQSSTVVEAHAQFIANNFNFPAAGGADNPSVVVKEAFGRINRLSVGQMDTAFGDPSAEPETLDLAGPNARITINPAGLGTGHGRISYDFFSPTPEGLKTVVSLEQPQPHIETVATSDVFARYPDFITATQYVNGNWVGTDFYERWHLQFGSLVRDLGLENADATNQRVFGWGTSFSGAYRFQLNPCLTTSDRVMFSVTYGNGISRYITDLNNSPDSRDAVLNGAGALVSLPVLAWYAGYTHNWTDNLRSTATYSQVALNSVVPLAAAASPYRVGDYVAANLVYHMPFTITEGKEEKPHNFFTGLEYLFGHKQTLDGSTGEAHRIMWVTSVSQ
jgi:hypothetical protein